MLEKVNFNQTATNKTIIEVTPNELREAANRLEKMAMTAQPNQITMIQFTDTINFAFQKIQKPSADGAVWEITEEEA